LRKLRGELRGGDGAGNDAHLGQGSTKEVARCESDDDEEETTELLLQPGSVLVMAGNTQEQFEHSLPLCTSAMQPPRISLTFRSIVPGFERTATMANEARS
jgi:hypothetical protein